MVPGLLADVFHRQGQALFIAEDGLVLRPVVLKHPLDVLLPGAKHEIDQENEDLQNTLHQIPAPQGKIREKVQNAAGQKRGQNEKQAHGQAHAQKHGKAHQQCFQLLAADFFLQPLFKLGRLAHLVLRVKVRRIHQGLDPLDHGVQKIHRAPDEGPAQNGVPLLDEVQLLHLFHQVSLLVPHHDGLLFRPPHENAFNEGLSADAGAEAGPVLLIFCHVNGQSFLIMSRHKTAPLRLTISCIVCPPPSGCKRRIYHKFVGKPPNKFPFRLLA